MTSYKKNAGNLLVQHAYIANPGWHKGFMRKQRKMKNIPLFLIIILFVPTVGFADAQQAQRNEVCGRQQSTCIANCKDSQCMTTCYSKYIACRGGK